MPICENCNTKWNWEQTIKKMFAIDGLTMVCPCCGKKQYLTKKSRIKCSLLLSITSFSLVLLANYLHMSIAGSFSFLPVLIIIVLLFFPHFMELSSTR
ncbi:TIGR04104 family putative zinc finger protein [Virgibacillus halophilus]|uniref:TIGR04104 family putative zinc finger protein n=1 Tax=Tigheibacillus halophilus TaxID=361280 RepID=UPI00363C3846